jgi:3-oxoacyl-[acyl-carrier protein] reductase
MAMNMRTDLTGRIALVTGASSGMGEASAIAMAASGARVALVGRARDRLEATRTTIVADGGEAIAIEADLSDAAAPAAVVDATVAAFGGVDALVHAAGLFGPRALADTTAAELDEHWAVNVRAPFLITQAAVPHMAHGGTVVFVSSTVAHRGFGGFGAYTASKGAVQALTRALAMELAPAIRVNDLAPGFVATPMVTTQYETNPAMESWLVEQTPMSFVAVAEDIANAVLFLSSDASRYMTGQTLVVDGGWTSKG